MALQTPLLQLGTPLQGTLSGTWGNTVNNAITEYVDIAIAGTLTLTGDGAVTLDNTLGSATASLIVSTLAGAGTVTAQFAIVRVSGTTVTKVVTGPSYSKTYVVDNASSFAVTFKASSQTGVTVAVAEKCTVYYNGTDYVKVASSVVDGVSTIDFGSTGLTPNTATSGAVTVAGILAVANGGTGTASPALVQGSNITITGTWPNQTIAAAAPGTGTVTSVSGTGTVNGISLSGTVTSSGSLTLGGTLSGVNLSTQVTGTLPIANGGTGQTSYTDGQLLIGNTTGNTLTKATLTAGTGITVTNASGSITIASTGSGGTSIGLVRAIAVNCILC